ncbi:integral membrane protein [Aspergillus terreus]|uniref:Integral membrane protein n=1 Tax=Aspergillus terreus TaxID=33178 RepID=A0A5M3Z6E1_ASPTE|nr:hypothetical protein ATETN484_0009045500 [Aspergillus terreus]GFF17906.1 integral membrane protein [Aspergillus terreus]
MTSPAEQIFLFGAVEPEPPTDLAKLFIIDLTAESGLVVGVMVLLTLIFGFWDSFNHLLWWIYKKIFFPIMKLLYGITWFTIQLSMVRSLHELHLVLDWAQSSVKIPRNTRAGRIIKTIWDWYFPSNKPLHSISRILPTTIFFTIMYKSSIRPAYWYLSGFVAGFRYSDFVQTMYCMDSIERLRQGQRMSVLRLLQAHYCLGQEDAAGIRADFEARFVFNDLIESEIKNRLILAWTGVFLVVLALVILAAHAFTQTPLYNRAIRIFSSNPPIIQRERDLHTLISAYDEQIANIKYLLLTKNAELSSANKKLLEQHKQIQNGERLLQKYHRKVKEDRIEIEKLSSRPAVTVTPWCSCQWTVIPQLRQEIASRDSDLSILRYKLHESEERESEKTSLEIRRQEANIEKLKDRLQQKDVELEALMEDFNEQGTCFDLREKSLNDRIVMLERQLESQGKTPFDVTEKSLKDSIARLEHQLSETKDEVDEKSASFNLTEASLKDHISQLEQQLSDTKAGFNEQNSSFQTREKSLQDYITQLEQQLSESKEGLNEQNHSFQTREKSLQDHITQLEQQLSESKEGFNMQTDSFQTREKSLQDHVAQLEEQLAESKPDSLDAKEQAQALQDQIAQLEQQLSSSKDAIDQRDSALQAREKSLQDHITQLEQKLTDSKNSSDAQEKALRDQIAQLEQQLSGSRNDIDQQDSAEQASEQALKDRITELEQELSQSKEQIETMFEAEISSFSELLTCQVNIRMLEKRLEEAESQPTESSDARCQELVVREQHLNRENEELVGQVVELGLLNQKLDQQNKGLTRQHQELISNVHKITAERDTVVGQCKDLEAKYNDLTTERGALVAQYQELQQRCNFLEAQHYNAMVQHEHLSGETNGLSRQHEDLVARHQAQTAETQRLVAENQALASRCSELESRSCSPEARSPSFAAQQERDEALGKALYLQQELEHTKSTAERLINEANEALNESRETAAKMQQSMQQSIHDIKSACDSTIEQQRARAGEAELQVIQLTEEVNDLQVRIGMAMRDAQRKHEEATQAQQTIQVLENRLSKWENRDGAQEIMKRQTGHIGSISTALEQAKLTVAQKDLEIENLRRAMAKLQNQPQTPSSDQEALLHEQVRRLRTALETEKRARSEDMIQTGKQIRELTDENRKLTVSLSNIRAAQGSRLSPRKGV